MRRRLGFPYEMIAPMDLRRELASDAYMGGAVIPDAKLGYVTLGELNAAKDNVVVCPTWFTATPSDTAFWLTGPDRALNPEEWFIVIPNHFGGRENIEAIEFLRRVNTEVFGRFPHATTAAWYLWRAADLEKPERPLAVAEKKIRERK